MEGPFTAYQGDDPYIFVSYAHDDADLVFPELNRLRDAGFNVWYDEGIRPGSTWREEVALALTESKLFLYFVTDHSVNSENCHQELNFALSRERKILAVHLTPVKLTAGIELSLSNKQAILKAELSNAAFAQKLTESVRALMPVISPVALPGVTLTDAIEKKSIAILPFNNRSSDPENEYLCDGISEELITGLARLEGLRVASQLQSFAYKGQVQDISQIGQKLKAANVLTGSIQKSGERVRITATLTETATGDVVWSERYDGTLQDVFELQEDVAVKVVKALEVQFSDAETAESAQLIDAGTSNHTAYRHYLLGLHEFRKATRQSRVRAHEHFGKAVAEDPGFGRAYWFDLIDWWVQRDDGQISQEECYPRASAAYDKLRSTDFIPPAPDYHIQRRLDPSRDEDMTFQDFVHEVIGNLKSGNDWHGWELAQLGFYCGGSGLLNTGREFLERYLEKYPAYAQDSNVVGSYGNLLFALGRFEKAIDYFSAMYAQSNSHVLQLGTRAMLYSRTGQYQKAAEDLAELGKTFPRNFAQFYDLYWRRELDAANAYFEWMDNQPNLAPLFKIWGCFLLGHIEKGMDYLEQADFLPGGLRIMVTYALTPSIIREVCAHPRYQALLANHGVDDHWQEELVVMLNEIEHLTGVHASKDEDY